jgi:uncharacterized Zn-binding protein involved in type VI secretion
MPRKLIVVGDTTTHGGMVVQGSPNHAIDGRALARLGDAVECPQKYPGGKPHGINKIIEGDAGFLVDGIPVACDGHKTACGCALIGSVGATVD